MPGDVDRLGDDGAVQPFVEQQIGPRRNVLPRREGARLLPVGRRFLVVVEVFAHLPGAALAIRTEQFLEILEEIRLRAEMAEPLELAARHLREFRAHLLAVVAMEGVAFDDRGR